MRVQKNIVVIIRVIRYLLIYKNQTRNSGGLGEIMKENGLIEVDLNNEVIFGKYLKSLFDVCFGICDSISLTEPSNKGMTKKEYEKAEKERKEYEKQEDYQSELGMTEEVIKEHYKDIAEPEEIDEILKRYRDNNEEYNSQFKESAEAVKVYVDRYFSEYKISNRIVTCITPCTLGGACVMYYFEVEDNIKKRFYEMEELFSRVMEDNEWYLDDPVFYKAGKIVLSICSHEGYATLYLTEIPYKEFLKQGVPHLTEADKWWNTEEFMGKYSVPVFVEEAAIIGGILGGTVDLYERYLGIDQIKQIFRIYKGNLEPNRILNSNIIDRLREKYVLKEYVSEVIEEQIKSNVYNNLCFARRIKGIEDMEVHMYELDCEGEKIIIGTERNSGYLCADMPTVIYKIKKFRESIQKSLNNSSDNIFVDEAEPVNVIFGTNNSEYISQKCCEITDEITALRGLDEFDLRKPKVVANYLRAKKII